MGLITETRRRFLGLVAAVGLGGVAGCTGGDDGGEATPTEAGDGDEHEGSVVYRVPEGAPDLYWVFDFGEWGVDRREFWRLR